jgi:hypothetical protein
MTHPGSPLPDPGSSASGINEALISWYLNNVPAWSTPDQSVSHYICLQGRRWVELEAKTSHQASDIVRAHNADPTVTGIYITQALMEGRRKAANARQFKSVWLDVDAKDFANPGDDARTSARRILKELSCFQAATKMPPVSCLVWSGGGVHCYWSFAQPIGFDQWATLAAKLKAAALYWDFHADLQCTTDAARVLRIPGTMNRKPEYENGRQTTILFPELAAE